MLACFAAVHGAVFVMQKSLILRMPACSAAVPRVVVVVVVVIEQLLSRGIGGTAEPVNLAARVNHNLKVY